MRKKSRDDEEALGQEAGWETEAAKTHQPRTTRRAILSVAFSSEDLELINEAAVAAEMKVSEFVRNAAIDRARFARRILTSATVTMSLTHSAVFEQGPDTQVYGLSPNSILMEV